MEWTQLHRGLCFKIEQWLLVSNFVKLSKTSWSDFAKNTVAIAIRNMPDGLIWKLRVWKITLEYQNCWTENLTLFRYFWPLVTSDDYEIPLIQGRHFYLPFFNVFALKFESNNLNTKFDPEWPLIWDMTRNYVLNYKIWPKMKSNIKFDLKSPRIWNLTRNNLKNKIWPQMTPNVLNCKIWPQMISNTKFCPKWTQIWNLTPNDPG